MILDKLLNLGLEVPLGKGLGGARDFRGVKVGFVEFADSGSERGNGLLTHKEAVFAVFDEVTRAAFLISDNWATGGESFDRGDTEGFEAGEKITATSGKVAFDSLLVGDGEKFD